MAGRGGNHILALWISIKSWWIAKLLWCMNINASAVWLLLNLLPRSPRNVIRCIPASSLRSEFSCYVTKKKDSIRAEKRVGYRIKRIKWLDHEFTQPLVHGTIGTRAIKNTKKESNNFRKKFIASFFFKQLFILENKCKIIVFPRIFDLQIYLDHFLLYYPERPKWTGLTSCNCFVSTR